MTDDIVLMRNEANFLDGYKILEKAGEGSGSAVYRAVQISLEREVALKILNEELSDDSEFIRRFEREAVAVSNLSHPNIVKIYDVSKQGELHYLVMEYCSGSSLREVLSVRGKLSVSETGRILKQICAALDYIHMCGFVHRDIKPSNIIICNDGEVKITDLGIARAIDATGITVSGTILGTPEYMSPEQVRGESIDRRSDVYSLGILAYEMVTGRVPFRANSPLLVARQQVLEVPPRPSSFEPSLPKSLERVILKSISKCARDRYQSCAELIQDWDTGISGAGTEYHAVLAKIKKPVASILLLLLVGIGIYVVHLSFHGPSLTIEANPPECDVYVDGRREGKSPQSISNISLGKHHILVKKGGYYPEGFEVDISTDRNLHIFADLRRRLPLRAESLYAGALKTPDDGSRDGKMHLLKIPVPMEKGNIREMFIQRNDWQQKGDDSGGPDIYLDERKSFETAENLVSEKIASRETGGDSGGAGRKMLNGDNSQGPLAELGDKSLPHETQSLSNSLRGRSESHSSVLKEEENSGAILVGKIAAVNRATGRVILHIGGAKTGDVLVVLRGRYFLTYLEVTHCFDFNAAVANPLEGRAVWRLKPGDIVIKW